MASSLPQVSVVMSVYDKPDDVKKTIDSVLSQTGVELECVIVSDGASGDVHAVLNEFIDPRIKVIEQRNQGLTVALINGCQQARYPLIARIDAGDCMLPDRLLKQATELNEHHHAAFISCAVEFHTDEGFRLYTINHSADALARGLAAQNRTAFVSPVHASVMFKKSAYEHVGGYRAEFYFAQDCDLWARMVNTFELLVLPEVLQHCVFSVSGISGQHADKQRRLADLVVMANRLRAAGENDDAVLKQAQRIRPNQLMSTDVDALASDDFDGLYFVASMLSKTNAKHALIYWRQAVRRRPFNLKARIKWLFCQFNVFIQTLGLNR